MCVMGGQPNGLALFSLYSEMNEKTKENLELLHAVLNARKGKAYAQTDERLSEAAYMGSMFKIMAECIVGIGQTVEKLEKSRQNKPSKSLQKTG